MLALLALTFFGSCTKESDLTAEIHNHKKTGVDEDYPYEIYDPGEGEVYLLLESGLQDVFAEGAENDPTEISRAIWLWESGINYFHLDPGNEVQMSMVSGYEDIIIISREVTITLEQGEVLNSDIQSQLILTNDDILEQIGGLVKHNVTDVQFVELDNNELKLNIVSKFYTSPIVSAASTWLSPPVVDPATVNKRIGSQTVCGSVGWVRGVWDDVESRVKKALPQPVFIQYNGFYTNVVQFHTYGFQVGSKYIDGSYLPGHANALYTYHQQHVPAGNCLPIIEQNTYQQALADQLHAKLAKRYYWDGIASLNVANNLIGPSGLTLWSYKVYFATWPFKPTSHSPLTPSVLFN